MKRVTPTRTPVSERAGRSGPEEGAGGGGRGSLQRPRALIVLGMHRSGTSAVTRVCSLLGADIGRRLLPAQPDNPRGFWELEPFAALHERMFEAFGRSWHDVRPMPPDFQRDERIRTLRTRLLDELCREFESSPLWVAKDPRISRLLPVWIDILEELSWEPAFLVVLRSPAEVAASLSRRNGFPAAKTHLLWLRHNLEAELHTRGQTRAFVRYDRFLADWRGAVASLGEQLGIRWPQSEAEAGAEIDRFLEPRMQHHRIGDERLARDPRLSRWVRAVYDALSEGGGGARRRLDRVRARLADADRLFAPVLAEVLGEDAAEVENARSLLAVARSALAARESEGAALRRSIEESHEKIQQRDLQIAELTNQLQGAVENLEIARGHIRTRDDLIEELRGGIGRRDRELASLRTGLGVLRENFDLARGHIEERDRALELHQRELQAARADIEAGDRRAEELRRTLAGREAELAAAWRRLDESRRESAAIATQARALEAQVGDMLGSASFRLTRPLRAARRRATAVRRSLLDLRAHGVLRALPLAPRARHRIKTLVFTPLGFLFRRTEAYRSWQKARTSGRTSTRPAVAVRPGRRIEPGAGAPTVSIIIPVHGRLEYTLRCLDSLRAHPARLPYEVIVVDDASPDRTGERLSERPDIRYLRNPANAGFIRSCNRGAREAQGDYLVFLNNDTEVTPGWLDELLGTFALFPDAGLVGARLLYPDGRLQEAGGILWRDASAWNFGRFDDPERPEYSYARRVDYCSAACICIPSALFRALGGFDRHYEPAYGEDSDLALRVQALGFGVLYQPLARILHAEGATSGTDERSGVKSHQVRNRAKLRARWADCLGVHRPPGDEPHLEKDRHLAGRALFIDACTPTPDQDAGSLTAFRLMETFQSIGFKVTFIPEDNFLWVDGYTPSLQRRGIECIYAPYQDSVESHLAARGPEYDVVVMFRYSVARKHLDALEKHAPQASVVFHTSDLHSIREERAARLRGSERGLARARATRDLELEVIRRVDCTIVHSTAEAELLEGEAPGAFVYVFPWILDAPGSRTPFEDRRDLMFLGGFQHPPNADAALYFVQKIYPLVKSQLPDLKLYVVGSNPPPELLATAGPDVIVTGYVPDLAEHFDRRRLSVAPIRYGAGIKGKIAISMGYGMPCVASPMAVEGMDLADGAHVVVAEGEEAFAEAVVAVYRDPDMWNRISTQGAEFIRREYSFERGQHRVAGILGRLGRHPFSGRCNICGMAGAFELRDAGLFRDDLACSRCGGTSRERSIASALLEGVPDAKTVAELAARPSGPEILDIDGSRPLRERLEQAPFYRVLPEASAETWDEVLPFPEAHFDFIVASGPNALQDGLHADVFRCLKPSGVYLYVPPPPTSSRRALPPPESRGGTLDVPPPPAHDGGLLRGAGSLQHRIYSRDGAEELARAGFELAFDGRPVPEIGVLARDLWMCRKPERPAAGPEPDAPAPPEERRSRESRLRRELEVYRDVVEVHDLPPIFHYWSNRHLRPILADCGIDDLEEFFLRYVRTACRRRAPRLAHVVSLGAGNGDVELRLGRRLRAEGIENLAIECVELNPDMLQRARTAAAAEGLAGRLRFTECDAEDWRPRQAYDVCIAHQSLHHFSELEEIFERVQAAIGPDGVFLTSDVIGRNGHARWPEALTRVHEIWRSLPDRCKYNHILKRHEELYENWDCSADSNEGIRAQDILPLLSSRFHFEIFVAYGNLIDVFVDRAFGPNFDPDREEDRRLIDAVAEQDEALIDAGVLSPTHLIAAMRCRPVEAPVIYRRRTPDRCLRRPDPAETKGPGGPEAAP